MSEGSNLKKETKNIPENDNKQPKLLPKPFATSVYLT